jgi:hypothetical protein
LASEYDHIHVHISLEGENSLLDEPRLYLFEISEPIYGIWDALISNATPSII